MKIANCSYCSKRKRGYPAGPEDKHVCLGCRRRIGQLYALSDPWLVKVIDCDACNGIGWGHMQMSNEATLNTACPSCGGDRVEFRRKSPLILLAECAEWA